MNRQFTIEEIKSWSFQGIDLVGKAEEKMLEAQNQCSWNNWKGMKMEVPRDIKSKISEILDFLAEPFQRALVDLDNED